MLESHMLEFRDLISPTTPDVFFAEHWQKKWILLRDEHEVRNALLDWDFFARLVEVKNLRFKHKVDFVLDDYDIHSPIDIRDGMNFHGVERLNFLCQNQMGLKFSKLQHLPGDFETLSLQLHNYLKEQININAYFSPPGTGHALAPHADPYDVFVIQLFGEKTWQLSESPKSSSETLITKKGDVLYIPRKTWHAALNEGEEASMHLTIGVLSITAKDVLEWVGEQTLRKAKHMAPFPLDIKLSKASRAREEQMQEMLHLLAEVINDNGAYQKFMKDRFKKEYACSTSNPQIYRGH